MRSKPLTPAQLAALLDLAVNGDRHTNPYNHGEHKGATYERLAKQELVSWSSSRAGGWFITPEGLAKLVELGMGTVKPTVPPTFIRKAYLHLCKDGTISVRLAGKPVFNGIAFPVLECASEQEAMDVQVLTCKLQHNPHPDMAAGTPWYKLASGPFPLGFSGEYEDVVKVESYLRECLVRVRARSQPKPSLAHSQCRDRDCEICRDRTTGELRTR